ncbi:MAG: hypothetical protein KA113_14645 [Syntrophaceae bacterium]|jgi:hypothetical protein|nr:hypothetical protein [Syntrophaceae bacterium]
MPEVFTITFFASWLCNREIPSRISASSVRRPHPSIFQNTILSFSRRHILRLKKLLAGFSTAKIFWPPEIQLEKGCDRFVFVARNDQ